MEHIGKKPKQKSLETVINRSPELRAELCRVMLAIRENANIEKRNWTLDVSDALVERGVKRRVADYMANHSRSASTAYNKALIFQKMLDDMNDMT